MLAVNRGNVMSATLRGSPVRHRATRGAATIRWDLAVCVRPETVYRYACSDNTSTVV